MPPPKAEAPPVPTPAQPSPPRLPQTPKEVLQAFGETTSVKGVSRVLKAKSNVTQAFWIIAVVVCFSALLYNVLNSFASYFNYDINAVTRLNITSPKFPLVTVCNMNPYSDIAKFPISYDTYTLAIDDMETAKTDGILNINKQSILEWLRSQYAYIINCVSSKVNPRDTGSFVTDYNFYTWDSLPIMHNFDVSVAWEPHYYKCYTFNPPSGVDVARLSAVLYIDNFPNQITDYFTIDRTQGILSPGVFMSIHPQGTPPDFSNGVVVSPGTEVTAKLTQTNLHRVTKPTGNCVSCANDPIRCHHSLELCYSLCRQMAYVKECHCVVTQEMYTDVELNMANGIFCSNLALKKSRTPSGYTGSWTRAACKYLTSPQNANCQCTWPCNETTYGQKFSTSQWPHKPYQLQFYQDYIRPNPVAYENKFDAYGQIVDDAPYKPKNVTLQSLNKLNLIEKNFMSLNIYFTDQMVSTTTEKLTVTWDSIISSLGGALNFWVGMSVIFAAELIELVYDVCTVDD